MNNQDPIVLSGMRPTGRLHLGHLHGVLNQWTQLQHQYRCFFFVADWHALTTQYRSTKNLDKYTFDMVVDWLACGVDPNFSHLFVQSHIPEHAELFLLLSMITPKSWLERIPSYKDKTKDFTQMSELDTYGFLGYPLLQAADILLYRANFVPVGEDQLSHVELVREIARRFNFIYGRDHNFQESVANLIARLGSSGERLMHLSKQYREQGSIDILEEAKALLSEMRSQLNLGDVELLEGYLEGECRVILSEPKPLVTTHAKIVGLDGRKMSKSYENTILVRDEPAVIESKIKSMLTDPARVRKTDPGDPEKCPVWSLHELYTDDDVHAWVQRGCRLGTIGCLECKRPVIEEVQKKLAPIQVRIQDILAAPEQVRNVLESGREVASQHACETLEIVRENIGLNH